MIDLTDRLANNQINFLSRNWRRVGWGGKENGLGSQQLLTTEEPRLKTNSMKGHRDEYLEKTNQKYTENQRVLISPIFSPQKSRSSICPEKMLSRSLGVGVLTEENTRQETQRQKNHVLRCLRLKYANINSGVRAGN